MLIAPEMLKLIKRIYTILIIILQIFKYIIIAISKDLLTVRTVYLVKNVW